MLLREVLACNAHTAPHGCKAEYFERAANSLNGNRDFSVHVDGKSVRDRYERMQKLYNQKDRKDALLSGVGGEVTEADELLSVMREAREEHALQRNKRAAEVKEREDRKLAAGAAVVAKATRVEVIESDGESVTTSDRVSTGSGGVVQKRKRRRSGSYAAQMDSEMDRFTSVLKEGDTAQRRLDERRLSLEERRLSFDTDKDAADREDRRRERDEERKERREERESRDRLELEKFKLMMDMLKSERDRK